MVVHVFNPSHDEALAINSAQYCPSSAARKMAGKLWDVAKYWAKADDFILRLPDNGSIKGVDVPDWNHVEEIQPWGWDRHIVGVLRKLGAPDHLLPNEKQLDVIRELSSRKTTVRIMQELGFENRWCKNEDEVLNAIESFHGKAFLKAPWSCSGRGVWLGYNEEKTLLRVRKILREQGAVEVEPVHHRVADFAMEFWSDGKGSIQYEGLSFFATAENGAYQGNLIAPQSVIEEKILDFKVCTAQDLQRVRTQISAVLASIISHHYRGPLGVDMMLTPQGIVPCIEVNLRNTMGRVAIFQQKMQENADF